MSGATARRSRKFHPLDLSHTSFYDGGHREKSILRTAYEKLARQIHSVFKVRIPYSMTEDFVIKYLWSATGYALMSIPVFFPAARQAIAVTGAAGAAPVSQTDTVASRTESE